jgi:hypothetical protein
MKSKEKPSWLGIVAIYPHKQLGFYEKKVEFTPEFEQKILDECVNVYGTGTEEGYIDKIVKLVFKELKKKVK